jgi:hypothetical protein
MALLSARRPDERGGTGTPVVIGDQVQDRRGVTVVHPVRDLAVVVPGRGHGPPSGRLDPSSTARRTWRVRPDERATAGRHRIVITGPGA